MGWANCGTDSKGRPIGYAHEATCDHPGCEAKIHRGIAYACGGMHGEDEVSCEDYFCTEHLSSPALDDEALEAIGVELRAFLCADCCRDLEEYVHDELAARREGGET